jgi:UDP-N-acetylglucosamine acyltransferase
MKPGTVTTVGDNNMLMAVCHVAHDCCIGNRVIVANNVLLAGHVSVGDGAFLSGSAVVHQFCRIGTLAMLGALARVGKDVAPYVTVDGGTNRVVGLNMVGIRRAGITPAERRELKEAYRTVFRSELPWEERIAHLKSQFTTGPAGQFQEFFQDSIRSFCQERMPKDADGEYPRLAELPEEDKARNSVPFPGSDQKPRKHRLSA